MCPVMDTADCNCLAGMETQKRVLIVEDDQTQGKALHAAFARAGYDAHLADSSAKALGHARRLVYLAMRRRMSTAE